MRTPRPLARVLELVDWFEDRGVYVPGEDNRAISPWRDFGWLIATIVLGFAARPGPSRRSPERADSVTFLPHWMLMFWS